MEKPRPFGFADLLHRCADDEALAWEIAELMRHEVQKAQRLFPDADGPVRARLAHGMKGAARNCGAHDLAERAARVEVEPTNAEAAGAFMRELARTAELLETLSHASGEIG